MKELYIGLMSGTSMDGVDASLCRIDHDGRWQGVVHHGYRPFHANLKAALMDLQTSGADEIHRAAMASNALALVYAEVVKAILHETSTSSHQVQAIGAHGQTVRHQPGLHDGIGYTTQLNNPSLLAELCGIAVVADFRSRDVAAGGQGAPLVPPFHAAVFSSPERKRAVVNIGGISNLTSFQGLRETDQTLGWDCGPGNVLLDWWIQRSLGLEYDKDGAWGATGSVEPQLLSEMLKEPFFHLAPPKSTGRDLFNAKWLDHHLLRFRNEGEQLSPQDVQATLCELTARVIAKDVTDHAAHANELLVCGGGALNLDLMSRLQRLLPQIDVMSSAVAGLPPIQVESAAFAWLAAMHCQGRAVSNPSVTRSRGVRVLGVFHHA